MILVFVNLFEFFVILILLFTFILKLYLILFFPKLKTICATVFHCFSEGLLIFKNQLIIPKQHFYLIQTLDDLNCQLTY